MSPAPWDSQDERELIDWARATPPPAPAPREDWSMATIPELVQDIIDTHHTPLRHELRRMGILISNLVHHHGELAHVDLEGAFMRYADDITAHLDHEEATVFPLSIVIERVSRRPDEAIPPDCEVIAAIRFMNRGHDESTDALRRLIMLVETMSECSIDPDLALIGNGLIAMLGDFTEHEAKEQGILMPAVIFAEELIRSHVHLRKPDGHEQTA